jgi:hypothetical protein
LTTNNASDSQVLGDLLDQIPLDEWIDSVYTDGAYDTKYCRKVISDRPGICRDSAKKKGEALGRQKTEIFGKK